MRDYQLRPLLRGAQQGPSQTGEAPGHSVLFVFVVCGQHASRARDINRSAAFIMCVVEMLRYFAWLRSLE